MFCAAPSLALARRAIGDFREAFAHVDRFALVVGIQLFPDLAFTVGLDNVLDGSRDASGRSSAASVLVKTRVLLTVVVVRQQEAGLTSAGGFVAGR